MKCIFSVLFVSCFMFSQGQNAAKEGIKQIALLQLYIGYLQKGYSIAKNGLNTISNITDGHWKLDINFFNSLKMVNPTIRRYAKVAAIFEYQVRIARLCSSIRKMSFTGKEEHYVEKVINTLLTDCNAFIDLLTTVITDSQLRMSDDERIRMIDCIYKDILEQYGFLRSFSNEASLLLIQRQNDKDEVEIIKQLNGL